LPCFYLRSPLVGNIALKPETRIELNLFLGKFRSKMLRYLPMAVGILGGLGLMLNRFLTPALTASQSRSDALAVIESLNFSHNFMARSASKDS
jgi:hypothetical protein